MNVEIFQISTSPKFGKSPNSSLYFNWEIEIKNNTDTELKLKIQTPGDPNFKNYGW